MPEISRFFGLIIAMYYNEHLPPHFHVRYGEQEAAFRIADFSLLSGQLSPRALGLVMEWAARNQKALEDNWKRGRDNKPLEPIEPLK